MLPSDWATFFGIDVGAATGLAGLLFVAFSVYLANQRIDRLSQGLGQLYFGELFASLIIALAATLPPHAWWVGGLLGASPQIVWWFQTRGIATVFRRAYLSSETNSHPTDEDKQRAQIYQIHQGQERTLFVPLCESTLVFAGSVAGCLAFFGILPSWTPAWLPLQIVGLFAAWYLISATMNAWFFLFRLSPYPKNTIRRHAGRGGGHSAGSKGGHTRDAQMLRRCPVASPSAPASAASD